MWKPLRWDQIYLAGNDKDTVISLTSWDGLFLGVVLVVLPQKRFLFPLLLFFFFLLDVIVFFPRLIFFFGGGVIFSFFSSRDVLCFPSVLYLPDCTCFTPDRRSLIPRLYSIFPSNGLHFSSCTFPPPPSQMALIYQAVLVFFPTVGLFSPQPFLIPQGCTSVRPQASASPVGEIWWMFYVVYYFQLISKLTYGFRGWKLKRNGSFSFWITQLVHNGESCHPFHW